MLPWIVLCGLIVFLYFKGVPWMALLVIFIYFGVPTFVYRRTKAAEGETTGSRILPKLKNAFKTAIVIGLFLDAVMTWWLTLIKPVEAGGTNWLAHFYDAWTGMGLPFGAHIFYFLDMWMLWGAALGLYLICRAKEAGARRKEMKAALDTEKDVAPESGTLAPPSFFESEDEECVQAQGQAPVKRGDED
ncbi:MAG: hypothetical protein LBN33_07135 [Desulfovibrio sp.]|jgi:phosphatidylglycerophosphate synthase|nr:hypothetical protein [Desulfovibrio sp.]